MASTTDGFYVKPSQITAQVNFSDLSKMPHFLQTSGGKTLPIVPWHSGI